MGSGEKTGREEKDMSGKNHVVGVEREKYARNPKLEANRQVEERKLGVWGKKREEKPMAWVWGEKSK